MWTSHKSESGRRILRYACIKRPGTAGCGKVGVVGEPLDQLITDSVLHRLSTPGDGDRVETQSPNLRMVDLDLARIERDLEGLAVDFGDGTITRRASGSLPHTLERRLSKALPSDRHTTNGTAALAAFRDVDVRVTWDKLDVDRRRAVLNTLIDRIAVNPAARPGQRFQPDRIDVIWKA